MYEPVRNAYEGVIHNPLPGRSVKPRTRGETMIIDKGLGLARTGDLLDVAGEYIDYVKLTFGTAALYPEEVLRTKVALVRSYGIAVYPGGTFLEVAMVQDALEPYLERTRSLGFTHVEVSDGTISLSADQRRHAIRLAQEYGLRVITEVGKKESGSELDPDEALAQIEADLSNGAVKVILEGRESGKGAGLYDGEGRLRLDPMDQMVRAMADPGVLMWEAPLKSQQEAFIAQFGPDVSLGNIPPEEVVALEALRRGLRSDTLRLALHER
ncbi:MAG: phosphosulfolactate synthase [Mycobacterium leprae]